MRRDNRMAQQTSSKQTQPPLVDRILQCGKLAFDPALPEEDRIPHQQEFSDLIESTKTLALLPVLNLLVQPERVQSWLRAPIIAALARIPLRHRGVQHTIEFVFSVHPTTAGANSQPPGGRGAAISHDALNAVSRLLSSPPAGMKPEDWFPGIAPQLFSLLEGEGELEMDKAAAFVIGFGILGRRQYGAPGTPGWKAFIEPIYRSVDPALVSRNETENTSHPVVEDTVINLRDHNILTSADSLAKNLRRLSSLLSSHPNPALTKRVLRPILLPLWSLSSWPAINKQVEDSYRKPAKYLLKTLIQLSMSTAASKEPSKSVISDVTREILNNLLFRGKSIPNNVCWVYATAQDGCIQAQKVTQDELEVDKLHQWDRIDSAVDSFLDLFEIIPDLKTEISPLFLELFVTWMSNSNNKQVPEIVTRLQPRNSDESLQSRLIEAKIIQKMMTTFPDKLVENSIQVLDIVNQVLADFIVRNNNEEDSAAIALSLLNIVLTSPTFKPAPQEQQTIESISASLKKISMNNDLAASTTAKNILLLLRFRSTLEEEPEAVNSKSSLLNDQQQEDRKSYSLAMSYLTATDSPPPVRAQGLELITSLIRAESSILDIPALLILFSALLQDNEEYIYLRAIKSFIELSHRHPKAVLKDLIDRYVDATEEAELDQRLRLGEALLQVIQNRPLAFNGDVARTVCDGLLFIASRRGYRPKTELQQERTKNLKRKQDSEAEEAWDGPVPQLDEVLELEAQQDEELMSRIVGGWESNRGQEDIRIRASALSILGSAIEVNIAGLTSTVISTTVDLSIHILTLEPEPEKGILRRSAVLLIMAFVRALDTARQEGRRLGFGFVGQSLDDVQRILGYVESSDNDDLVRQHARDVIEGLQAWQMNALIPPQKGEVEIQELAGLAINPLRGNEEGRVKPRIEEVED